MGRKPGDSNRPTSTPALALRWRLLISLVVILQLLAIVAEPFQFFTRSGRGTSPAADPVRRGLAAWVEFGYLNHGYFFFAPEPGPSHLMDCRLTLADGQQATLSFPDRQAQWPRLLYHRHFMMAENLHQLWAPPADSAQLPLGDPMLPLLKADRERFEMVRDSMRRHLQHRYNAENVVIERVEHRLPSSDEVLRDRISLDDPQLYVTLQDTLPTEPGVMPPLAPGPGSWSPWLRFPSVNESPPTSGETPAEPVEVLP